MLGEKGSEGGMVSLHFLLPEGLRHSAMDGRDSCRVLHSLRGLCFFVIVKDA